MSQKNQKYVHFPFKYCLFLFNNCHTNLRKSDLGDLYLLYTSINNLIFCILLFILVEEHLNNGQISNVGDVSDTIKEEVQVKNFI